MKTSQNNYLSIVLGRRILGYSQAQYVYNTLYYGQKSALHFSPPTTLTQTLRIVCQMPNGNTFRAMMTIANGAKAVRKWGF